MTNKLARFIATCGPIGSVPYGPGTAGSVLGILFVFLCQNNLGILLILTVAVIFIGVWSSSIAAKDMGIKDPSNVVIDEVCGVLVSFSFIFVSLTWIHLLVGFILFRLFDIFKPVPIRYFERLPGGVGIVSDDVVAGIYSNIILQILIYYAHI